MVFIELICKSNDRYPFKNLACGVVILFLKSENQIVAPGDFFLPFGGKLNKNNRWVQLSDLIPWTKIEDKYARSFKSAVRGQKALPVRVALGALIIQQRCGFTDRETVQQIAENPYLQYFIGLSGFHDGEPFHHSLMTHFRQRLGEEIINEINEWIALEAAKTEPIQTAPEPKNEDATDGQLSLEVVDGCLAAPSVAEDETEDQDDDDPKPPARTSSASRSKKKPSEPMAKKKEN